MVMIIESGLYVAGSERLLINNTVCKIIEIFASHYVVIDKEDCRWSVAEDEMEYISDIMLEKIPNLDNKVEYNELKSELECYIQNSIGKFEDTLRNMIKKYDVKKIYDLRFKIQLIPLIEMESEEEDNNEI